MKTIIKIFAVAALSLTACGDNIKGTTDGSTGTDGSGSGSGFPAAPTLGSQIDRMGRPAVNTALNHVFDPTAAAGSAKDAYNHDESVGTWPQTWAPKFAPNLAIFDAVDTGYCGNGLCEATSPTGVPETLATCPVDCPMTGAINAPDACGNQAFYNGSAGQLAYVPLAGVLADDELYLETSKSTCAGYLAVEFFTQVLGLAVSTTCGGRAPSYDVIDTTYTLSSIGVKGFDPTTFAPAFKDNVGPHTDISDTTFPFLGAPH